MAIEQTLVILKPDAVQRMLVGDIIHRFERVGLKMIGLKMVWPSEELAGQHYTNDPAYLNGVGEKATAAAKDRGETLGQTPREIGDAIRQKNMVFLSSGPVIVFALEGNTAVETVRNIVGGTNPLTADIGTIRGDYTIDDFTLADSENRTVRNLVHASDSPVNGQQEIALWFTKEEIHSYQTVMDKVLHDPSWGGKK